MPTDLAYERYLTPDGRTTLTGAVSRMREVGSSELVQEHLIMQLATEFKPVFDKYGADLGFFKRIFSVNPSTPPFIGSYRVSREMQELVQAATTPESGRGRRRAGSLHLLEATLQHSQGRLRGYIMHAEMLRNENPNDNAPDDFWEEITAGKRRSQFSIVA